MGSRRVVPGREAIVAVTAGASSARVLPRALFVLALVANIVAAMAGHVVGDLAASDLYLSLTMALWTSLPWLAYGLLARRSFSPPVSIATGLLLMALYVSAYAKVFFFATSSTDGVAVVVMPLIAFTVLAFALLADTLLRRAQ